MTDNITPMSILFRQKTSYLNKTEFKKKYTLLERLYMNIETGYLSQSPAINYHRCDTLLEI